MSDTAAILSDLARAGARADAAAGFPSLVKIERRARSIFVEVTPLQFIPVSSPTPGIGRAGGPGNGCPARDARQREGEGASAFHILAKGSSRAPHNPSPKGR